MTAGAGPGPARCAVPGYDAVLLAGFGGPEGPDDVLPFLRNVTAGRGIPDGRLAEVSHHYLALGGVSPINEQNRRLRAALEARLSARDISIPVLWGNRNWAPLLADVVTTAHARGQVRLLGLATSAYASYSSCRQYREDFAAVLASTGLVGSVRIDKVPPYSAEPGFRAPFADGTVTALELAAAQGLSLDDVEVVFSTHSIPISMAQTSGPAGRAAGGAYVAGHLAVCRAVIQAVTAALGHAVHWRLAYQSRSGPPSVPWLEPDINDAIGDLAAAGRTGVVVVPIGFISDHMEVIWDLDHEAAGTAAAHGLFFARVATPGTDARFVAALAGLVAERLGREVQRSPGTVPTAPADACLAGCCANRLGSKPTVGAADSAADWSGTGVLPARLLASGIGAGG